MKSLNLPIEYKKEISRILDNEYNDYIDSFQNERTYGIRFNSLKIKNLNNFIKKYSLNLQAKIEWTNNGYTYNYESKFSKDPLYFAGLYYLQDPSAMAPASILPINHNDKVLDLCAAPGGKSTEILSKLEGTGLLISNDISSSRCKALIKNLEMWNSSNVIVTSENSTKLSDKFESYFDKILIDAPCSGEGMFRKEPKMINAWLEHGPSYFSSIQKTLIKDSIKMLKPGGYILYSTCSYSLAEDEENLKWALDNFDNINIVKLPTINNINYGRYDLVAGDKSISNSIKFFSHKINGEGQFVSLLQKTGDNIKVNNSKQAKPLCEIINNLNNITTEAKEFLSRIKTNYYNQDIVVRNDNMFLQNNSVDVNNLRVLRNGLLLGVNKKNRFEPSQALAMTLSSNDFDNVLILDYNDDRVIRYLKGETIFGDNILDGYVLICIDDYPLGWGKCINGIIKNKYLIGWRYN